MPTDRRQPPRPAAEYSEHGPDTPEHVRGLGRITHPGIQQVKAPFRAEETPRCAPELDSVPPSQYAPQGSPGAPRRAEKTIVGIPRPAPGSAPMPDERPSLRPAPWDDTTDAAIAAEAMGFRVHRNRPSEAPATAPTPRVPPIVVAAPPRPQPWWEREDGVAKVLGALGALIAGVFTALQLYRASAPPPPPPGDIKCPPFADEDAPRGALCTELYSLQKAIGALQADRDSRRAREDREKKMLEQEPPKLTK